MHIMWYFGPKPEYMTQLFGALHMPTISHDVQAIYDFSATFT